MHCLGKPFLDRPNRCRSGSAVEDKATREPLTGENLGKLMGHVLSHGGLMVPCGRYTNVMRVMPSLTIPRKLLFKALDVFGEGLRSL